MLYYMIIVETIMGLWLTTGLCTINTFQEQAAKDKSGFSSLLGFLD